jgi:beta-lactamase class A
MIVISDDNAWEALNTKLGYDNLQAYAATLGITDYQAYNNVLSSGDVAIVLQKLWDGELLNSAHTQQLLGYMKQANYRQYIVPAIPADDTIYHKIGLYQDNVHDAAIITHGSQAFAIVIYTNGNGVYNWPGRATIMQDITKAALKAYFNQ